ncbi:MAG TPA: PEPxxWA-CTERM sorting domain-containing protein [Usitatibacter sp.]|nr:PEPxxWA-CTERM sorting domain-containing protein [Usitatibacter sp.]
MKPIYQAVAIAVTLGAAGLAYAAAEGNNPLGRPAGSDPFHSGPLYGSPRSTAIQGPELGGIGRPKPSSHAAQVTPVPEPSQWAMMIAGLALVGFIVRRNRNK